MGSFHCFLDCRWRWLFWTAAHRRGGAHVNFVKEAQDVSHALLDLWVAKPVTSHSDKFFWPEVAEVGHFARRHDDPANQRKPVVLQEFVLLETLLREYFRVVADDVWLAVAVHDTCGPVRILDAISREEDALAEEVGQDVVGANELKAPI